MRKFDVKRFVCILFFLALAGFSCFWTAESLFIWQPEITKVGAWLIAIIFYIVASLSFIKVHKSLDRREDFYGKIGGRGGSFLVGFFGLLIFWLFVSLPTNTHTLLYRAAIKDVVIEDLMSTKGYLTALRDNNLKEQEILNSFERTKHNVTTLLISLNNEIDDPRNQGIGPDFRSILNRLNIELMLEGEAKIPMPTHPGTTRGEWQDTYNHIENQVNAHLENMAKKYEDEINRIGIDKGLLTNCIREHENVLKAVRNMKGIDNDILKNAMNALSSGYAAIKADFDKVPVSKDLERFTRDGAIPKAKEMLSVPDVWADYFTTNKYDGHGFIWWVLIALLVDLSAFVFFDIAFGKNKNNPF